MKRSDMLLKLQEMLVESSPSIEEAANDILTRLEKVGMKPPALESMKCQAILDTYYEFYTFNMWDEDFEKDEKLVKAYEHRKRSRA